MRISTGSTGPLVGAADAADADAEGSLGMRLACHTTVASAPKMMRPIKNAQVLREFLLLNGRSPAVTNNDLQLVMAEHGRAAVLIYF